MQTESPLPPGFWRNSSPCLGFRAAESHCAFQENLVARDVEGLLVSASYGSFHHSLRFLGTLWRQIGVSAEDEAGSTDLRNNRVPQFTQLT